MLYGARLSRRSDALRNRTAIIEAASAVLGGPGSSRPIPEIARRAGIGQATLYRHFPDRNTLIVAVIEHHLAQVRDAAAACTDLRPLLREVLHAQIAMRPLVLLAERLAAPERRRIEQHLVTAFAEPLRHAQQQGLIRADLTPADLLLLFTMVRSAAESAGDAVAAADRSIDLLLHGIAPAGSFGLQDRH
ncbi:TetR/AcrR family transcriptional regulator [Winogradskya consettensis]|uniref:TetR/AcrR family transcriptional regulator n=1 Tax=Winogradskya consettensis TaxID=113560 RepID=UPI001BB3D0BE|nr:TetR/AcrR family transcriptional regulator [Actinoplanes consettensis]